MLPSSFYKPENLYRMRHVYLAIVLVFVSVCAWSSTTVILDLQRLHKSTLALKLARSQRVKLSKESEELAKNLSVASATGVGGVESFAVKISGWAQSHGVQLESFAPQGEETIKDIKMGEGSVGRWAAQTVQLQGRGDLRQVMALIDQLRSPAFMPAQLNSFQMRSMDDGKSGKVTFHFILTVYENKTGVG